MVELVAYRYRIPLQPRLELRGSSLSLREGVLLGTSFEADVWADAAPLPGLLEQRRPSEDGPLAYICHGHVCGAPLSEFGAFEAALGATERPQQTPRPS